MSNPRREGPTIELDVSNIKAFLSAVKTPGSYSFTMYDDKKATRLISRLRSAAEANGLRVIHVIHSAQFYSFDIEEPAS